LPHHPIEETIINKIAAIIFCTITNHVAIFQYIDHISHLSDMSFIIIIVLLNVIAIAIYAHSMFVNHNVFTIKYHITDVKMTCQIHVTREALPVSLIILALSHIHTIKRSRDIHI
jgi:hypothetical protein